MGTGITPLRLAPAQQQWSSTPHSPRLSCHLVWVKPLPLPCAPVGGAVPCSPPLHGRPMLGVSLAPPGCPDCLSPGTPAASCATLPHLSTQYAAPPAGCDQYGSRNHPPPPPRPSCTCLSQSPFSCPSTPLPPLLLPQSPPHQFYFQLLPPSTLTPPVLHSGPLAPLVPPWGPRSYPRVPVLLSLPPCNGTHTHPPTCVTPGGCRAWRIFLSSFFIGWTRSCFGCVSGLAVGACGASFHGTS